MLSTPIMFVEKTVVCGADEHVCCRVCNCLGYCAKQNKDRLTRPGLKRTAPHTFREFVASANRGCRFCNYTLQGFQVLGSGSENPEVELLFYDDSPTELHSANNEDACDIVEIYSCTGSESPLLELANDVPRENVPETAMQFVKRNYEHCCTFHTQCPEVVSKLPKRVLDISTDQCCLYEPVEGTEGSYVTLSYSWGGAEFPATTRKTYQTLKRGFEKKNLPPAFQDAAMIAQSLCIDFLWIDSLCIIQDDAEDWEEQAAQMGQIYESATITIAASLSGTPYESLFSKRNSRYEEFELFDDMEEINAVVFKARRKIPFGMHAKTGRSREKDPLDTRAWGLQEKLLSCRLISFTGGEIQWTCRTSKVCQCRRKSYTPQALFPLPDNQAEKKKEYEYSKLWSKIVEPYADRNLTIKTDRLPALSGLARKFRKITNFTYVAGLWQETIWYDLMWQCDISQPTQMVDAPASSVYMGPSFSWVSAPSTVNYRLARHTYPGTRIHHMDMVSCDYITSGHYAFGRAMGARMYVRGTVIEACVRCNTSTRDDFELCIVGTTYHPNADQRKICEFSIDVHHWRETKFNAIERPLSTLTDPRGRPEIRSGDMPVVLIAVYSIHHRNYLYQNFLILKPSLCGIDRYERVGIGSGKIYNKNDVPALPELVQPFDWLSVDFGSNSGNLNTVADQTICLI